MLPPMRCGRKVPRYCNKSSRSCLDLWRTNTTTRAQLYSQSCKQSSPAYVPVPILVHLRLTCRQYKRSRKLSTEPLDDQKRGFLASLQAVILKKMKWEEGADLDDVDEDDRAAFESLRKVCQPLIISYMWTSR